MFKILARFIFIFLFFISGCSIPIQNLDSQGENIICFGDSITYGVGAEKGKDYPSFLQKLLKTEVINVGVPGDTTEGALRRLDKDILEKDPYLVIVELGGNDFLRRIAKEKTLKNLEKIILKIQERGAIVAVCDISCGFSMSGYRRDFKKLAGKTGSIFIPRVLEDILTDPSLKYDNIHPNSEGYETIAFKIYKTIRPYLK